MAELGNILEPAPEGPRGPDLHVELEVPRAALGAEEGFRAPVPLALPHGGERVERTPSPFDDDESILLRLPESFPSGGVLKLRGQGGASDAGSPGDLLAKIIVVDGSPVLAPTRALASATSTSWPWIVFVLFAAGAAVLWVL